MHFRSLSNCIIPVSGYGCLWLHRTSIIDQCDVKM